MKNTLFSNEQLRLNLLEKCYNLGLPASSKDDINTLKMYLIINPELEIEDFNYSIYSSKKHHNTLGKYPNY